MKQSSKHFNDSADTWDQPGKIEKAYQYSNKIKLLLNELKPKFDISGVIEIGCGTGLLGGNFMSENISYVGIDSSVEMLKILKKKFPQENVHALNVDAELENFEQYSYNLVLSQMAFHHLQNPLAVIKKFKRNKKIVYAIIDLDKEDGTFHPDPEGMGVKHFGFSKSDIEAWTKELSFEIFHYEIINIIEKNDKKYPLFLAIIG